MFLNRLVAVFALAIFVTFFSPEPAMAADGWMDTLLAFIREQQQDLHRQLADAMQAVAEGGFVALSALIGISFLYGVFHAAGPGHGKAVISAYILSHKSQLKQSVFLSVMAALVQGLSAIILVQAFAALVTFSSWAIKDMVPIMEQTSFLFVALIGLFLIWRALRQLGWFAKTSQATHHHHEHQHSHEHHHHDHHHHDHAHGDGTCSSCGHVHAVTPDAASKASSFKEQLAIIFSVGIRPCSGSVIVLTFAELLGLSLAGILSVLAISTGTAITVSLLAIMSVFFRDMALSISERQSGRWVSYLPAGLSLLGGIFILFVGGSLFLDAFGTAHPLL